MSHPQSTRETPSQELEDDSDLRSPFNQAPSPVIHYSDTVREDSINQAPKSITNKENFSKYPDLPNFECFEFDEMEEVLERIVKENEFVEEEMYLYEAFLKKMNERSVASSLDKTAEGIQTTTVNPTLSPGLKEQKQTSKTDLSTLDGTDSDMRKSMDNISVSSFDDGSDDASSVVSTGTTTAGKKKKKRRQAIQEYQLTYENKIEIALKAIDILRNTIEKENKVYEKEIESMRARVQEADMEIEEVDKEHLEFRKEVVEPRERVIKGSDNTHETIHHPNTGILSAEKISQYFKNKQQQKDTLLHKLKLNIAEIKKIVAKSRKQLESREQSGDQLTKTDFDQLKIENGLMNNKIDERNAELVDLKLNTGALLQKLSALTEKLNKLNQETKMYKKEMEKNKKDLESLKEEIEVVLKDKDLELGKNQKMVLQHDQVKVPEILSYVKLKAELDIMRKEAANWQRKVEIQSMNESNTRKKLQGLFMSSGVNHRTLSAGSARNGEGNLIGILTTNSSLSSKQFKNL